MLTAGNTPLARHLHPAFHGLPLSRAVRRQATMHQRRGESSPSIFDSIRAREITRRAGMGKHSVRTPRTPTRRAIQERQRRLHLKSNLDPRQQNDELFPILVDSQKQGYNERQLLRKLTRGRRIQELFDSNKSVQNIAFFVGLLVQTNLPRETKQLLAKTRQGNLRSPNLGSFCERRVAVALSKLLDHSDNDLILDFWLCGESASPIDCEDFSPEVQYNKPHGLEEPMAIDLVILLKPESRGGQFFHFPLQIKASGKTGWTSTEANLRFNKIEMEQICRKFPKIASLFGEASDGCAEGYFLRVERKIYQIGVGDRKGKLKRMFTSKAKKKQGQAQGKDLMNEIYTAVQKAKDAGKLLVSDIPWMRLTGSEKVIYLIQQGFLKPIPSKAFKNVRIPGHAG